MLGTIQGCSELDKFSETESRTKFLLFRQDNPVKPQTLDRKNERNPGCVKAQDGTKPELNGENVHFPMIFAIEVSAWFLAGHP